MIKINDNNNNCIVSLSKSQKSWGLIFFKEANAKSNTQMQKATYLKVNQHFIFFISFRIWGTVDCRLVGIWKSYQQMCEGV